MDVEVLQELYENLKKTERNLVQPRNQLPGDGPYATTFRSHRKFTSKLSAMSNSSERPLMSSLKRYTQILNSEVSPRDNLYSLMETIKLLMIHTARVNMDKSVAGSITQSIANSIPVLAPKFGASSHETYEERREREKHELSVRQTHKKLFSQIEIIMLK